MTRPKKQEIAGEVLYVAGAASYLGCSEKAVRRRVERGLLPHRRLGAGGRICFLKSELLSFIENLPGTTVAEAQENLRLRSGEVAE